MIVSSILIQIDPTTIDGRNPAPVEVSSLSHYLQGFYTSQVGRISSMNRRNLFKETEVNDSVLIFEEVPLLPQPKWHSKLRCWALSNTRPFVRLHETTVVDTCLQLLADILTQLECRLKNKRFIPRIT